jgi:hypothetical protein
MKKYCGRFNYLLKSKNMATKINTDPPADKIALYDRLIATNPAVERKGKTNPYTSYNGNMFTHLSPAGVLALRLPEKEIEKFIKKYKAKLAEAYGIVRKDYVEVPDSLLKKTNELKAYFDISYEHVKTLKAKPTTKIKK